MSTGDKRLSVAVVGAGRIAGGYDQQTFEGETGVYSHAGGYRKSGKFRLETVYDTEPEKARNFKEYWKVSRVAEQFEQILTGCHDVVSVCTPDETHFEILEALLERKCCKTIFVEKPIALTLEHIKKIIELSRLHNIHVVVDFQRNFDPLYVNLHDRIHRAPKSLLAANGYYMKGLSHSGSAMIDILQTICGLPDAVLTFNRVWNQVVEEYTYEFILFYGHLNLNITVKSIESASHKYNYHIFELDLLFSDSRISINDNSRHVEKKNMTRYAYGGVNVLDDRHPVSEKTGYDVAILNGVDYVYRVTCGQRPHTLNTPRHSYNIQVVTDAVVASFEENKKLRIEEDRWFR